MPFLSEYYLDIRHLHVATAVVSILLFIFRFLLMLQNRPGLGGRWLRVLPHVNDSLLLAFAVLLCIATAQYPLVNHWLTWKVVAVIGYIISGMFALKWSKSSAGQVTWFLIACLLFTSTARIAVDMSPAFY